MKSKKTYDFRLVLKNVDENTADLEDSLYEAGCDDALINFKNGRVYLDFNRESYTFQEAVISAIKDIKSASIEIEVASVAPEIFVTESEISKRLKVSRQTVSLWIKGKRRKSFPSPVMRLSDKSPLWNWSDVVCWLFKNKIITDKELVDDAFFLENVNAVLEEQDEKTKKLRQILLEKIFS